MTTNVPMDIPTLSLDPFWKIVKQINPDYKITYADGANKDDILIATI
jgi:hypothetical protein